MQKKKAGLTIFGLLAVLGAGTYAFDINIGNTTIGQIGDNVINNYLQDNLGIDIDEFREQCASGVYTDEKTLNYCKLV